MTLGYLTSTLSEEEYLAMRFAQAEGTGRVTRAAINNAKYFCQDAYNRELIIVMADIRKEVEETRNLDTALIFLQKLLNWSAEDHTHIMTTPNACNKEGLPVYKKDTDTLKIYVTQMRLYMKKVAGIQLSAEDVKDYKLSYPPPQDKEEAVPLELAEFRMICENEIDFRRRMLYRIMKDCEARIGAMVQLRRKDFNTEVRPIQVTFPRTIVKKNNGISYTNIKFVAKEDEYSLLKLLQRFKEDDLVFGTNEKREQAINNEEQVWARKVQELGFTERYKHNGHLKKNIHSIKAMTFTAAEEAVSLTYAHAYGDHALYTKTYLRWNIEKKIAKFKQLEPHISMYEKIVEVHDSPVLHEENIKLNKKVMDHDDMIEVLSEMVLNGTKVKPDGATKRKFKRLLQENNLL